MNKSYAVIAVFLLIGACQGPYSEAQAGGESHGGNVVFCPGKQDVILDYYHAALPNGEGTPQLEDVGGMNEEQILALILEKLDGRWQTKAKIADAWKRIGPVKEWILADLKQLNDSNEPYFLSSGCTKKTGAARQGEVVYRDPVTTANLNSGQLGILRAHETVYLLATESGLKTSENVLSFFREVLRKGPADPNKLDRALRALGLPTESFHNLKTGTDFHLSNAKSVWIRLEKITFANEKIQMDFIFSDNRANTNFGWQSLEPGTRISFICTNHSAICTSELTFLKNRILHESALTIEFKDLSWIVLAEKNSNPAEDENLYEKNRWELEYRSRQQKRSSKEPW